MVGIYILFFDRLSCSCGCPLLSTPGWVLLGEGEQQYHVVLFRIGLVRAVFCSGTTGKPRRAWHWCMGGAWVHGVLVA